MHISEVQMTEALVHRKASARDWQALDTMVAAPLIYQSRMEGLAARCEQARELCRGTSAGISMFGTSSFDRLVWLVTSGELSQYQGEIFPRQDSPCGVCFDYRTPQLFCRPHLYFSWMAQAGIEMDELLVAPIQGPFAAFFGTLWVACRYTRPDAAEAGNNVACFNLAHAQMLEKLGAGIWAKLHSAMGAG